MKSLVQKRARIVKIRLIEKQVAELALAKADRNLKHIESIVERLAVLKSDLNVTSGTSTGASLASRAETKSRLTSACSATARPLADAINRRSQKHSAMMVAHQTADGAKTLLKKSSSASDHADAVRADANRVARRISSFSDDAS